MTDGEEALMNQWLDVKDEEIRRLTAERDFYRKLAADRGAELDLVEQERDNALLLAEH